MYCIFARLMTVTLSLTYWKGAFLIMFAVFCAWVFVESRLQNRKEEQLEAAYWEREARANSTRRKPIDHLDYITIPDNLYFNLLEKNIETTSIRDTIDGLRKEQILNLTGYSNTDLKLEYGTANITKLSACDSNYTILATTLQKWADILLENGYQAEAVNIMEFLVSTKVDIGRTYKLLTTYYIDNSMPDKLDDLLETAQSLKSLNTPYIVSAITDIKSQMEDLI